MNELVDYYKGKTILVTGGSGSIGSELVRALVQLEPASIRVFDYNETGLFELEANINSSKIRLFVGDVRDKDRLRRAMEGVDLVFHAAALKHVPLCEYNPFEAVKTNVLGTQNVIESALDERVEKLITISTDKAVHPVNVMGATKLLAEKITQAANMYKGNRETALSVVRFGNVLNSRGSILPIIKTNLEKGTPITLTDPGMTRFIMGLDQAVRLSLDATTMARGGEIFILKMPIVRIQDLIEVIVNDLAPQYGRDPESIDIKVAGVRPGEKLTEELISEEEWPKVIELENMYVLSSHDSDSYTGIIGGSCREEPRILSKDEIRRTLVQIGYLPEKGKNITGANG